MAYGDFKDIARKAASDKALTNRAFNIAKNLDINEYLLLWFTNVLIKSQKEVVFNIEVKASEQLPEELHKPIIRKF